MKTGKEHLRQNTPFNSPEWRWQRAQWIHNEHKRSPALDSDLQVREAHRFLVRTLKCTNDYGWDRLWDEEPDNCMAISFWIDPVRFTPAKMAEKPDMLEIRRQAALEAYLLAQLPHQEVANKMGLTTEAVRTYEKWFYDFRPKMGVFNWITTYATRGDVSGASGCSFEHMLRLHGWKYGVQAVDELLTGTGYSDAVQSALRTEMKGHLVKSACVASRNVYSQATLFEATNRMLESGDRLKEIEITAGQDYHSDDEKKYIKQTEEDLAKHAWCMVEVPPKIEATISPVEKRISVRLGLEPDLSIKKPSN